MYIKSHYCSLLRINQVKGCDDVIMTSLTLGLAIQSYLATRAVQCRSERSSGRCYHLTHLLPHKYLSILVSRLCKRCNNSRTALFQVQDIGNKTSPRNLSHQYPSTFFTPEQLISMFPLTHRLPHLPKDLNPKNAQRKTLC